MHTQWAPPFIQQYLAPFSSLVFLPHKSSGLSVCRGWCWLQWANKLKSQDDEARFAEQKGGFISPWPKRTCCCSFFLSNIILMSHNARGFFSPSSFLPLVSFRSLQMLSIEVQPWPPRHLISNLVSWEVAGVGFGGWSFKCKCSIAILGNFTGPSVLSSYSAVNVNFKCIFKEATQHCYS